MNVYDSDRMADVLAPLGYEVSQDQDEADMVILNTCHIREKATEKVFSELGRLKKQREARTSRAGEASKMIIAVAGCVAQAEGEEIVRRAPYVDMVFGPQTYHRLPEMVAKASRAGKAVIDTEFPVEPKFDELPKVENQRGAAAFLSVQEGCDKFCTFCVVPYTRGAEFSRPVAQILGEARDLANQGVRELTLLGQNVNAFHGEAADGKSDWGLGRLIRELADLDGIERIRYATSHPRDMDDDLIAAHGEVPELMPYLHLPIQSGSDRILQAMNRGHKADDYRRIIDRLRVVRPDLAMSSDFIVGFPGESDQDFADTIRMVNDVTYVQAYSFKYSPRPGTPAASVEDHVPEEVKSDRLAALQQLLNAHQLAYNKSSVGMEQKVLIEKTGARDGQLVGRGPYMQAVHCYGPDRLIGEIVDVQITEGFANSLAGEVKTFAKEGGMINSENRLASA